MRDGKLNLDSKEVKQLYLKVYTPIVDKCKKCLLWKNCEICVFYLPKDEEGQTVCPYYLGNEDVNRYFSTYIYALEKHPDLLDRKRNINRLNMENYTHWFYLESYTFLFYSKNQYVIYNTLNSTYIDCSLYGKTINTVLSILHNTNKTYCVGIYEYQLRDS